MDDSGSAVDSKCDPCLHHTSCPTQHAQPAWTQYSANTKLHKPAITHGQIICSHARTRTREVLAAHTQLLLCSVSTKISEIYNNTNSFSYYQELRTVSQKLALPSLQADSDNLLQKSNRFSLTRFYVHLFSKLTKLKKCPRHSSDPPQYYYILFYTIDLAFSKWLTDGHILFYRKMTCPRQCINLTLAAVECPPKE